MPTLPEVTKPLIDLLKSDVAWAWGPTQAEAFKKVNQLITQSPVLAFYDVNKPTIVSADASSYGLGGVRLQKHDGQLKPLPFVPEHSLKLNSATHKLKRSVLLQSGLVRSFPDSCTA